MTKPVGRQRVVAGSVPIPFTTMSKYCLHISMKLENPLQLPRIL